jgi:hypothetical protein
MLRHLLAATTASLFFASAAHAEEPMDTAPTRQDKPLSFWVYIDRTNSDWDINEQETQSEVDRVGFGFAQKFHSRVSGGVFFGYSGLSQDDNPPTEDISQSGGHIGLLIKGLPYDGNRFKIDAGGSIAYNLVNGDKDEQKVETSWIEGLGYVKGRIILKPVILTIGGNYQYIDGQEKLTGQPISENLDIKASENLSALAGIDVMINGGTIGFHGEWGARNSFALTFARDF